jgi:hypothetical protein
MLKTRTECSILAGASLGKPLFAEMKKRWENEKKMDFREVGCERGR